MIPQIPYSFSSILKCVTFNAFASPMFYNEKSGNTAQIHMNQFQYITCYLLELIFPSYSAKIKIVNNTTK